MAISTLCRRTPQKYLQQDTCTEKRGEEVERPRAPAALCKFFSSDF